MKEEPISRSGSNEQKDLTACVDPDLSFSPTVIEMDCELQRALLVGSELLGMMRSSQCDQEIVSQIAADISSLTVWMSFLLDQREHIVTQVNSAKAEAVNFDMRMVCRKCKDASGKNIGNTVNQQFARRVHFWYAQVEFLLNCTRKVGVEMFEHCFRPTLRDFPKCLDRLVAVLQRQQQIMSSLSGEQMKVGMEFSRPDICAKCGRTIEDKDYAR